MLDKSYTNICKKKHPMGNDTSWNESKVQEYSCYQHEYKIGTRYLLYYSINSFERLGKLDFKSRSILY